MKHKDIILESLEGSRVSLLVGLEFIHDDLKDRSKAIEDLQKAYTEKETKITPLLKQMDELDAAIKLIKESK